MEERQLDLNAPLISARRYSSAVTSEKPSTDLTIPSYYRSELKSGPVGCMGSVPFLWEEAPGRAKDGNGIVDDAPELSSAVSTSYPVVHLQSEHQKQPQAQCADELPSCVLLTGSTPLKNPAAVGSPNCKSEGKPGSFSSNKHFFNEREHQTSECSDDFSDARDSLSCAESFRIDGSLSGLSNLDDKEARNEHVDPETRQIMMDRFLPAARAVTSEVPRYTSRKVVTGGEIARSVQADEQRKHISRHLPMNKMNENNHISPRYRPYIEPYGASKEDRDEVESVCSVADDDDDNDDGSYLSPKAHGWLSRLCLRNTFCLLNPVPGMKARQKIPLSRVSHKINFSQSAQTEAQNGFQKDSWEAVYKYKLSQGQPFHTMQGSVSHHTSESNRLSYWSDSQTMDDSSPYRNSASSNHNASTTGFFQEGTVHSTQKNINSFSVDGHGNQDGSYLPSPIVEKGISTCSESILKPFSSTCSLDSKGFITKNFCNLRTPVDSEKGPVHTEHTEFTVPVPKSILVRRAVMSKMVQAGGSLSNGKMNRKEMQDNCVGNLNDPQIFGMDAEKKPVSSSVQPLLPPLLKSPSESWLCRTLQSMNQRDQPSPSYSKSEFGLQKQVDVGQCTDSTLEKIVKPPNANIQHSRFSKEIKTFRY